MNRTHRLLVSLAALLLVAIGINVATAGGSITGYGFNAPSLSASDGTLAITIADSTGATTFAAVIDTPDIELDTISARNGTQAMTISSAGVVAFDVKATLVNNAFLSIGSSTGDGRLFWGVDQTNDAVLLTLGDTSNTFIVADFTHKAVDYAHANQSNPTQFWHANSATTTLWGSAAHDGTNFVVATGAGAVNLEPASGEVRQSKTANGAYFSTFSASESFTSISTSTLTTTNLVPAGARLLYVVGLVDTTISGGGVTGADWGDGSTVDLYNNDAATAQITGGDTIDSTDYTGDSESWSIGTQDVTITFVGGTPTAGALTVSVFYTKPTAGS